METWIINKIRDLKKEIFNMSAFADYTEIQNTLQSYEKVLNDYHIEMLS